MQLTHIFSLLILHIVYRVIQGDFNDCQTAGNCKDCITLSPNCAWCSVLDYKSSRKTYYKKCDTESNHKVQKCTEIHNPKSSAGITKSAKLEGDTRVSPQAITLKLRPGQAASVDVKIKTPKNFPIDLYYLMDLSKSMADDLLKLESLADTLSAEMQKVTSNFRLGFGGYVDKPLGPYTLTSPAEIKANLETHLPGSQYTFGFKNYLPLNVDTNAFKKTVRNVQISFNVDAPEGSLEALMQVIVCESEIGWRDKRKARRIVIITTDQTFHYSGDGLLGGVVIPNDASCHLLNQTEYTGWDKYDYPSLSQIRSIMIDNQIVPIFASLGNDALYAEVANFFGQGSGALAQPLAADSSNIVPLVKEAYEKIAKKISITSTAPDGIDVKFVTNCGETGKDPIARSACSNVSIGQEVTFNTKMTAKDCNVAGTEDEKNFKLKTDFDDIDVKVEMICNCPCEGVKEADSVECTSRGTKSCGLCDCNKGFTGRKCHCTDEEAKNETLCRVPGHVGKICSGRGKCDCGECICNPPPKRLEDNEVEYIYGDQCQCSNMTCGRSNGLICGGPDRGRCDCGKCKCEENWTGRACGAECIKSVASCTDEKGIICGGKGRCQCNRCICDAGYIGEQCNECVVRCPDPCEDYNECVKCLAFDTSELTTEECIAECQSWNISQDYQKVDRIPDDRKRCIARDEDDCSFVFSYNQPNNTNDLVLIIVQEDRICPAEADIVAIILGVIAGIVGIGLALVLIWKLLVNIQDRNEFARFVQDKENPKWDSGENPIYKGATSTFQNPMYGTKKPPEPVEM